MIDLDLGIFNVGKYKNKKVADVISKDKRYVEWVYNELKNNKSSFAVSAVVFLSSLLKIEQPNDNKLKYTIKYNKRTSENQIQALLYNNLVDLSLDVQTDVLGTIYNPNTKKTQICHFDIVVFENKEAKAIIEVKRTENPKQTNKSNKQRVLYQRFGVPLFYCYGQKGINNIIEHFDRR